MYTQCSIIKKAGYAGLLLFLWLPKQIATLSFSQKILIPFNSKLFQVLRKTSQAVKSKKRLTIIELLSLAEDFKATINERRLTMSQLANEQGMTRARMTQIMNLLKLAPEIRDYIKNLEDPDEIKYFTEKKLRNIAILLKPNMQLIKFDKLKKTHRGMSEL
ncbi:MAG: hypothetical protein JSW26_28320 [Desulfobacterales bacterium]|nr:MAG: hypothetical protein JSW26_28320 [Desulfobacterales bacterium]